MEVGHSKISLACLSLTHNTFSAVLLGNIAAVQEQMNVSAAGNDSTVGESSPAERVPLKDKFEENFEPLGLKVQPVVQVEGESCQGRNPPFIDTEFHIENGIDKTPNVEHQFIPSFAARSPVHQSNPEKHAESKSLSALRNGSDEEVFVSLQLGEPESKRRKHSNSTFNIEEPK